MHCRHELRPEARRRGRAAADPADRPPTPASCFIGRVRSPWTERANCPKNMRAARETRPPATMEIDLPIRPGLPVWTVQPRVLLTWLDRARRGPDRAEAAPRG
jgi:tRNA (Thr-GGU) A37 N-methylase